jgi:hypothetical protein
MGSEMAGSSESFPAPWPAAVREFVEDRQERAYRRLGRELGLGSDAAKAFAQLTQPHMPMSMVLSPRFEDRLDVNLTTQGRLDFDATVKDSYVRYFSLMPPTRFEDPNRYRSMAMTLDQTLQTFVKRGQLLDHRPYIATMPSGDVNASIIVEPETNSPVIFFEHGLFQYIYAFVLLTAWGTPPLSLHDLTDDHSLARHRGPYTMPFEASEAFVGTLGSYVVDGIPSGNTHPLRMPEHNPVTPMFLLSLMEQFAMAHELSHIALGHLARRPRNRIEAWEQEYEADAHALLVMTEHAKDNGLGWGLAYWACDLTLTCFQVLDRGIALMAFDTMPSWASKSHPDAGSRRHRLREIVELAYKSSWPWAPIMRAYDALPGTCYRLLERAVSWVIGDSEALSGERTQDVLSRRRLLQHGANVMKPHVTTAGRAAAGELCGMSDAALLTMMQFATMCLLNEHQKGVAPSPLWRKRIERSFAKA